MASVDTTVTKQALDAFAKLIGTAE